MSEKTPLMYAFEKRLVIDGEPAFGLEGTFRIHDRIYVLSEDADTRLKSTLADNDYEADDDAGEKQYIVRRAHQVSKQEIWDQQGEQSVAFPTQLIVDTEYKDGRKHSLLEPDLHRTILSAVGQRSDLSYYNRDYDHFRPVIVQRMSAFVGYLVDVDFQDWGSFLAKSQGLHAQDFIKSMAAWASRHSDNQPRQVFYDHYGSYLTVTPDEVFHARDNDLSSKKGFGL